MKKRRLSFLGMFKEVMSSQRGSVDFGVDPDHAPESPEAVEEEVVEAAPEQPAEEESQPVSEEVSEDIEVKAETEAELEEEVKEAIEEGASEAEVQEMIRQYTLKVDGKEIKKEIDLNDEEAIIRELQLAYKGQKSTQELAEFKKDIDNAFKQLLANPFDTLQKFDESFDPLDYASKYIEQKYKEHQMSPEEKQAKAEAEELKQLREERDRLIKEKEDRDLAAQRKAIAEEIENDIIATLDGDSELVADRDTVAMVAKELMWAAKNGYDMSAKDVLPTVKDQLKQQFERASNRFKNTDILKNYMGKSLTDKLREARVEQAKKQVTGVNSIKKDVSKSSEEVKEKEKIKLSSLFG